MVGQRKPLLPDPSSGAELPGVNFIRPPAALRSLIRTERPVAPSEHAAMRGRWRTLREEDASLHVVTDKDFV